MDIRSSTNCEDPTVAPSIAWTREMVETLFELSFADLLYRAQSVHRTQFDPNRIQLSTLMSIKTGACPEDCAYCPQSARYRTDIDVQPLAAIDEIVAAANEAKSKGASRFCMGAAWRNPKDKDLEQVAQAVSAVKALGLETCATLGMLTQAQTERLQQAGLDYYNHNLDTSPEFYSEIITTRSYQDRLDTLQYVRDAGIKVCCGGIVGMGEARADRVGLLLALAGLPTPPDSVPINLLVQVPGTPLHGQDALDPFEFVRTVAVARITMPGSYVRLSAGREHMSDELQALCFFAGANSIFYGDKLLTTGNATAEHDQVLFSKLGIQTVDL